MAPSDGAAATLGNSREENLKPAEDVAGVVEDPNMFLVRSFVCLVLCTLCTVRLVAYPITKLVFRGNEHVSSQQLLGDVSLDDENPLKRDIPSKSELLLAVQHLEERIRTTYIRAGYLYVAIDSFQSGLAVPVDSSEGYQLTFFVREGAQYRVRLIAFDGAKLFGEEELRTSLKTAPGDVLNEETLKSDIASLLLLYEHRGYPLAKITIGSIVPSVDSVTHSGLLDIRLQVAEGRRAQLGTIVITGNTLTDASVITRELRLASGAYYDDAALETSRARVERLGFFESVSQPQLFLQNDSTVAILINVKEASTSAIDGVLGYNPPKSASQPGYLSGLVDLGFRNISGTGRNASLHYDRTTPASQTLEIHYLEPWLFGYPLNIALGFLQRQQDSSFTRTVASGDLSLMMSPDISLIGNLSLDRVIPSDQPDMPFSAYDSRTITTGLSARVDTRDDALAPRSGVLGLLGASYGVKDIYGPSAFLDSSTPPSLALRTVWLDASGYHTIFTQTVVGVVGLHARSVSASAGLLDQSDLFRLGGGFSIRGYREEELLASRYAYANLELRLMASHHSFFFGFFDIGTLFKDSTRSAAAEQASYPYSYGIGAQVESPVGLLTVSIGLARGEAFDQAKFHFGLVKEF